MHHVKILYANGTTDLLQRSTEAEALEAYNAAKAKDGVLEVLAWEVSSDGKAVNRRYGTPE